MPLSISYLFTYPYHIHFQMPIRIRFHILICISVRDRAICARKWNTDSCQPRLRGRICDKKTIKTSVTNESAT